MIILLAISITYFAFYLMYLSSDKQKKIVAHSKWAVVTQKPRLFKRLAYILFLCSFLLLTQQYRYSVAFVSWWIFATPLIFVLILRNNQLKSKK
ncbi:DUF1634 domain-containing protein [Acinetobacter sp. B5B]|uniref:DUF1634 domain-containing protein n=1 Tax=Acinetobacter baretiae TaxID=2605383 RepID=UPI0018C1F1B0|nr:DUF1634 domain-containing protein [Acinetobacter baretiae]MBF7682726.1 DUF1634 domain-containing protein [Acinetobacter baretiae]